jgi:PTS system nitrogen regulatory IIA component
VLATACALQIDRGGKREKEEKEGPSPMTIADLIALDRVVVPLRVSDKAQLLRELSQRAARFLTVDPQVILDALQTREALGSTGVGLGIALPHARIPGLPQMFGLFARLERPVDFDAIDEQPVDLVFLLLTPDRAGNEHLAALAVVARHLRNPDLVAQLRRVTTRSEAYDALVLASDG